MMAEKILAYLCDHPGARKREIAGHLHIWLCDETFLIIIQHLERAHLIRRETFSDPAQMEYYDKWYAVE
jgi:hypothetical protein